MDTSLQTQCQALKSAVAPRVLPCFGYFNLDVAQQWFALQEAFCTDPAYAPLRLSVASRGVIDCFKDNCNYQGMEWCMYDFRQAAARDYWTDRVLPALIDSPSIDGVFLDESDNVVNNLCGQWPCTDAERADLAEGTLAALDAGLAKAASLGKYLLISLTSTLTHNPAYLASVWGSLLKYSSGARYYEFFGDPDHLATLAHESQVLGIPVQVHTYSRTLDPRSGAWVELAMFLVAAGDFCYFSYSGSWNFDSFPWMAEYDLPLGVPAGPAVLTNASHAVEAWAPQPGVNLVCGRLVAPGSNGTSAVFLGTQASATLCAAAAARASATIVGYTWVDATGGEWSLGCYGLTALPALACLDPGAPGGCGAPCYAAAESGKTSAVGVPLQFNSTLWTRDFARVRVSFDAGTRDAEIMPRSQLSPAFIP